MLKNTSRNEIEMPTSTFVNFNRDIFFNPDITADEFQPLHNPTRQHISIEETKIVVEKHFKTDKSTGFSLMPLHVLKHMGTAGLECVTQLLNNSAIDQLPPKQWRTSKVTPLYKGKGDVTSPTSYRSIAVAPPLSKLFMAIMNRRLINIATEKKLHTPTQAGFKPHHGTIQQALILQTLIQHSIKVKR